ncbi:M23 family metallopeptidase [Cohnella zeiphila]|uniref:M23 family metallopeptidase n=1 Tax=Cohnella zeiphila TaxID=2761120 RepID=A0A7X0W0U2_9BACL|nr:M23 family metallopeptidase [Cohnella zeiphila]MBB6735428.1 M23 family metallopeptidase [Cohnella zeiphila]
MAVFKNTDRTGKTRNVLRRGLSLVRSGYLKGLNAFKPKTHVSTKTGIARYRTPAILSAAAIVVLAGAAFGTNQYVQAHTNTYYQVMLNGKPIGEISSQKLVEDAVKAKSEALAKADSNVHYELDDHKVTYETVSAYKKQPDDQATLAALQSSLTSHAVGVKLVVDGKTIAIVKDKETADDILERVKEKFVPGSSEKSNSKLSVQALSYNAAKEAQPSRVVKSVSFEEDVQTIPAEINASDLSDPEDVYKKLTTGNPNKKTYTVQAGDCIGCIAQKTKVPTSVIYANNPWIQDDYIQVGDVLDITQNNPVLNIQSEEEVTQIEVIDPPVEIRKSDDIKAGQQKTLREGTNGKRQVTYRLLKRNGTMIEEEQLSSTVLQAPVSTIILKGTKVIPSEGTGKFAWPVSGHKITSYYGTRWGRMHKGLDIVGNRNVMAADNGTVEFVGQKTGYGNCIIINHNNGFETLYGHLKSFNVKEGQVVSKGDVLGIMGETGDATGIHLHFEIHLNGKLRNPTSYL